MIKTLAFVAVATLCCGSAAWCQSSGDRSPPGRNGDGSRDRPPPASPADVPAWMAHAVNDILTDTGHALDDATHDRH